jgi:hypothetical protein
MTARNLGAPLSAILTSVFFSVAVGAPPVTPIKPPHGLPTKGKAVKPSARPTQPATASSTTGGGARQSHWSGNSATQILPDFAYHIGGSPYFNINTTYYGYDKESEKEFVLNRVSFKGSIDDPYSPGGSLSDNDVQTVVANAIVDIKFGHVGNSDQCPAACQWQNPSPNNNPAADDMASAIAHELEESVTDPDGNAWINSDGSENADRCAWTFGREMVLPDGATYNMRLGRRLYHIQRNWANARGGYCALSWGE